MDLLREGFASAWARIVTGDPDTLDALGVSLSTSLLAVLVGALLGIPLGAWLGLLRPRGHRLWVGAARVAMAVPTVSVGILLYGLLSRRGLLGEMGLIHTRTAIVVGQSLLALPILVSLVHASTRSLDPRAVETLRTLGAGRWRTLLRGLGEVRSGLVAALLTAFYRCVGELAIAVTVGGNIRFDTRTLPAQGALEISKGEFGAALAPGLLLLVVAVVAALLIPLALDEERA